MRKIFSRLKRTIAMLLVAVTVSASVISGYSQAVYAAAAPSVYFALQSILEAVSLSMGYSYSSEADLDSATKGLQNVFESFGNAEDGSDLFEIYIEFLHLSALQIGDYLTPSEYDSIFSYAKSYILSGTNSSYETPVVEGSGAINHVVSLSESFITRDLSLPVGSLTTNGNSYGMLRCPQGNHQWYESYFLNFYCAKVITPNTLNNSEGFSVYVYHAPANFLVHSGDSIRAYTSDGSSVPFYVSIFDKRTVSEAYLTSRYVDTHFNAHDGHACSVAKIASGSEYQYESLDISDMDVYTTLPVYSSLEQYVAFTEAQQLNPVSGRLVGSTDVSIPLPESVKVSESSNTAKIEEAIDAAAADGVSLTDEQLDAIASQVIDGLKDETGTGEGTGSETAGTVASIYTSVKAIEEIINSLSNSWTEGSSALQQDVEDIKDSFTVMEGGGQDPGDPDNNDPKVWIPPGFFVVNFLKPVLEYFGEPLSEITKFLDVIMDSLAQLPQLFDEAGSLFIGNIFTSLSTIVSYCSDYLRILENLPKSIADLIEIPVINPMEIVEAFNENFKFPLEFPAIPDISGILNDILSAVKGIFSVDMAAISPQLNPLKSLWEDHFLFIGQLRDCFSDLSFPETYAYPVIRIQTPTILKAYYDQEYIVLLDFKDYEKYFTWGRNLVSCMLWVGFAYSLTKHFRVKFNIA